MEEEGLIRTLQSLLPRDRDAAKWAEKFGFLSSVWQSLQDLRKDSLRTAIRRDLGLLLCLLLRLPQSHKSCCDALLAAINQNKLDYVKLLLGDPRAFPYPLMLATSIQNGSLTTPSLDIFELLLADKRVDPSASDQLALRTALNQVQSTRDLMPYDEHDENIDETDVLIACRLQTDRVNLFVIIEHLLADERVIPLAIPDQRILSVVDSTPRICGYLLMRPSVRQLISNKQKSGQLLLKNVKKFAELVEKEVVQIDKQIQEMLKAHLASDVTLICLEYLPDYLAYTHLVPSLKALPVTNYINVCSLGCFEA
jgi:hypothetical protein